MFITISILITIIINIYWYDLQDKNISIKPNVFITISIVLFNLECLKDKKLGTYNKTNPNTNNIWKSHEKGVLSLLVRLKYFPKGDMV